MKVTRTAPGIYHFTGHIAGNLVQYSVSMSNWTKPHGAWEVIRVYGHGPEFNATFPTKRAAIAALSNA